MSVKFEGFVNIAILEILSGIMSIKSKIHRSGCHDYGKRKIIKND